ncbi:MAG TPA: hypothetical protein VM432_14560 [Bdellovibrionales bacterium]|jgi:hypothetical protein|nr:hypothetical protein [Bdellovibrionales bacterium]
MYSHEDLKMLHGFLKSTGEGNLKKMLVGGKMTEVHLRVLLKIARAVSEDDFIKHCEADDFPKVKFSPPETAIKEGFWPVACEACCKVGLLTAAKKAS